MNHFDKSKGMDENKYVNEYSTLLGFNYIQNKLNDNILIIVLILVIIILCMIIYNITKKNNDSSRDINKYLEKQDLILYIDNLLINKLIQSSKTNNNQENIQNIKIMRSTWLKSIPEFIIGYDNVNIPKVRCKYEEIINNINKKLTKVKE